MSAEETAQDKHIEPAKDDGQQLVVPSSTNRRSRASSLLLRLYEESDTPMAAVGQYSTAVEETEIKDHRQVFLGVHIPLKPSRLRRSYRSRRYPSVSKNKQGKENLSRKKSDTGSVGTQAPADRVRFILGGEESDVERQIFTQMDELVCDKDGNEEWKETARWLRFEEDVEEGGNRWSKPHVASLSLYSVFELRSCILNGTVLIDLNANSIPQIADIVLDDLVASTQLDVDFRSRVRDIWLRKHHHLFEGRKILQRKKSLPLLRKKSNTVLSNMDKAADEEQDTPDSNFPKVPTAVSLVAEEIANGDVANATDPEMAKYDANFMKKIPAGAEGFMVLVGETDFLTKPVNAFVRLEDAQRLEDMMEVPIPVRFIFFMLGPAGQPGRYHEVGRSIATLMSDEVFHDVAYKASCRDDIAAGIDEFLQQVTVLPPGEWDPSIRIEPPETSPSQGNRRATVQHDGDKTGKENSVKVNGIASPGGGGDDGGDDGNMELVRTGRFGGGLILDIKRKAKRYKSDFIDALNSQCLASMMFIYFACLTSIVTFGGVLQSKTKNNMGAMEQMLAASTGGVLFALFSGQPLTILGATGPMLVFESILFNFCETVKLDYMPFRMWIGLWTTFYCFILVVTDASALVKYFTRFTEESFATLIGLIFVYEGGHKLYKLLKHYPVPNDHVVSQSCECMSKVSTIVNGTGGPQNLTDWVSTNKTIYDCDIANEEMAVGDACGGAVFLLSTILTLGTFFLVIKLKSFKTSRFFPTKVRKVVSDFAVIISVLIMAGVDAAFGVGTPKLDIPTKFQPTNAAERGWLIHPLGLNPWWSMIAASVPALLTTILVFMDQQITAVIVNKREHKLRKGAGYHLDLSIVGSIIGICSILGLPWVVAATVESLSHVRSLFVESQCTAPGERPKFLGVREQRVTGAVVFTLIGLTVFLGKFLKYIPMPVLYGLFIFMGVSALRGQQLFERMKILFMPMKHQPDRVYLRKVRLSRIHAFTAIQVLCLAMLWVIKMTPASITFPLMVLALVVVRRVMGKIFTKHELEVLDDLMPESVKKKIEEEDLEEDDSQPKNGPPPAAPPPAIPYSDSVINFSEELMECTIWKSMEGNKQPPPENNDEPRERKPHKHKHKSKSKHHHRHHGDSNNVHKLATVADAPDLETIANEDDNDSQAIPLVTVTSVDEHEYDATNEATADTSPTVDFFVEGDKNSKDTKPLRPMSC